MTDYTLVPNQSLLGSFMMCDVIRKEEIGTDIPEHECKQTVVVPLGNIKKAGVLLELMNLSSVSQFSTRFAKFQEYSRWNLYMGINRKLRE